MIFRALLTSLILFWPFGVGALDDTFTVGALIGDDTTPPSVPASVVAVPLSTSSIQVSWSASTDDTAVSGYLVFRDSIQIATTTLLSYTDTGLTASTTYMYELSAFDLFGNFSSTSAPVSTTTLSVVIPPPSPSPQDTDTGRRPQYMILLESLDVVPTQTSLTFSWRTNLPTAYRLHWGRTPSYEGGIITGNSYNNLNTTALEGLQEGTVYYYALYASDILNREVLLHEGTARTLTAPDLTPPANVSGLRAVVNEDDVSLSWNLPSDDIAYVRIVRNHLFYPVDPHDGFIVYEGSGTSFFDADALRTHDIQYYTVFSYARDGKISSGAVVMARKPGVVYPSDPGPDEVPATSSIPVSFPDVLVIQAGETILNNGHSIFYVDPASEFLVAIPYDLFPQRLKTILITLTHPVRTDEEFSFILRANADFTAYEAKLAPLTEEGTYGLRVAVFDVKNANISEFSGSLIALFEPPESEEEQVTTKPFWLKFFWCIFLLLIVLILLLIVIGRRRREDKPESGEHP